MPMQLEKISLFPYLCIGMVQDYTLHRKGSLFYIAQVSLHNIANSVVFNLHPELNQPKLQPFGPPVLPLNASRQHFTNPDISYRKVL